MDASRIDNAAPARPETAPRFTAEELKACETAEFGGKLAQQIGADLSGDRDEEKKDPRLSDREEAMQEAARPQDWKAKLAEMDHDARVAATLACIERKNNQKEILYDLLVFCREERPEEECEAFLEAHKQFSDGYHTASKYLFFLQRTGGLEEIEYDEEGAVITEERREALRAEGKTEDEVADLAYSWSFVTTPAGLEAIERFNPVDRTQAMLATQKEIRLASYRRLLEFCEEPKSLADIEAFMADDPALEKDERTGIMSIQPSAFISKLDQAGALTWDGGWKTTPGGLEVLASMSDGALSA